MELQETSAPEGFRKASGALGKTPEGFRKAPAGFGTASGAVPEAQEAFLKAWGRRGGGATLGGGGGGACSDERPTIYGLRAAYVLVLIHLAL